MLQIRRHGGLLQQEMMESGNAFYTSTLRVKVKKNNNMYRISIANFQIPRKIHYCKHLSEVRREITD